MTSFPAPGTPLPFEKCENFRELGGYIGADGRMVRRGLLFRGPALSCLRTENDKALYASLGVKTIFDFRSSSERQHDPDPQQIIDGEQHFAISAITDADGKEVNFYLQDLFAAPEAQMQALFAQVHDGYARMALHNEAYKAMFRELEAGNTPLYFHCTAGKDRTGVAAMLILRLLGVSETDTVADYLRTNSCRPENIRRITAVLEQRFSHAKAVEIATLAAGVKEESIRLTIQSIEDTYGSFDEYYFQEYGIDAARMKRLRQMYLV